MLFCLLFVFGAVAVAPDALASAACCAADAAASAAKAASAFFACWAAALGRDFDLVPFDCN